MTCIILVRHGQTEWNRVERFRGHADVPLNETGLVQAEATGHRIAIEWQPAAVYSSPLSRLYRPSAHTLYRKPLGSLIACPYSTSTPMLVSPLMSRSLCSIGLTSASFGNTIAKFTPSLQK
jgi:bisphosphoglycerate-dependent phosphoglycerate mutase